MINPATLAPGARLDVCEKSSLTNPPENKQCTFRFLKSLKRCTRHLTSCHLEVCKNLLTCDFSTKLNFKMISSYTFLYYI